MTPVQVKGVELPSGVEWTGKRVTVLHPVVGADGNGDTVPVRAVVTTRSARQATADGSGSGPFGGEKPQEPSTE